MSISSIPVIEKTVQKTDLWLKGFQEALPDSVDKEQAFHLLRAGLHTLRESMTVDETAHFGAQLPMLLRGLFYEGFRPVDQPRTMRTEREFCTCLDEKSVKEVPIDNRYILPALFHTLRQNVTEGQIEDLENHLPREMKAALSNV